MFQNFEEFEKGARRRLYVSAAIIIFALSSVIFLKSVIFSIILVVIVSILLVSGFSQLIKASKLAYAEREERASILASLSDGIVQYDAEGKIIYMNPRAEEFFAIKKQDLEGVRISKELWDAKPSYRALVEVIYPELAPYTLDRGGESYSSVNGMELHTSRPELRLFAVTKDLMDASGINTGHVKILRDISHEALISKIKSEFVSVAAHQLRTPLAGLKWTMKLFIDGDMGAFTAKQTDFLTRAFETTERMVKLVNDLLDAARIEEGRFGYEFKEIDYVGFVDKLLKNYELTARKHKILFVFHEVKDMIPPLYADPDRLSMALSNLIENAFRYTPPEGKIELFISKEGDNIKTVVADTGAGIPEEEQKRVFTKFFRASNAIRLETEGTGLGLFIVRNIIKRHGGEISFESKEGKGTKFTILLPIKREAVPSREAPAVEEFLQGI